MKENGNHTARHATCRSSTEENIDVFFPAGGDSTDQRFIFVPEVRWTEAGGDLSEREN